MSSQVPDHDHQAALAASQAGAAGEGGRKVNGCWMTLVTKDNYIQGLLVLHRTLKAVHSLYPLIAIITPSLPAPSVALINHAGIRTILVESLTPKEGEHELHEHDKRFEDTWTKLRCWEVVEFDRIVMMDCDMLVFKNMDELFEMDLPKDWIAAGHACTCNPRKLAHYPADWTPENCGYTPMSHPTCLTHPLQPTSTSPRTHQLLNSGLVVLTPSLSSIKEITHFIATSPLIPTYGFPDQDALAEIFRGRWKALPWVYNALKTLRGVHKGMWRDEELKNIHYILDKPWHALPSSTASWPVTGTQFAEEHGWWWKEYVEMLAEMKRDPESGWERVDKWVAH